MPVLPVDAVLPVLLDGLRGHGAAVLRAPTGAGKTTRVPPAIVDAGLAGDGIVVLVQPRRVAARAAARRIAHEGGRPLGDEVGYRVRFDDRSSDATRILVVTDGVLVRMLETDPFLERVRCVVFDEFHERRLDSDVALALVGRVRADVREDLRIVVMSATLDPAPIAAHLGDAPVIESEGRAFPVAIEHVAVRADRRMEDAAALAVRDVLGRCDGDVLVFLPGVGEIRRLKTALDDVDAEVHELHGELPPEQQDAAIRESAARKVILATNVAETSLTVPGVRAVVDTGLERVARFDPSVGMGRLERVRISRRSADQRAGRAGRTAPGLCVRLWGRGEHASLAESRVPEIARADLAGLVLRLRAWGESDARALPWFEAPPRAAVERAELLLERLGALREGTLTEFGREMAAVPAHPRVARMLLAAHDLGHGKRLALAAAAIAGRSPRARGDAHHESPSDVLDIVESLESFARTKRADGGTVRLRRGAAFETLRVRDQLLRHAPRTRTKLDADEAVQRAVLAAFPDRLARRRDPRSRRGVLADGGGVELSRSSAVGDAELFACIEVDGSRRPDALVHVASAVDRSWLPPDRIVTDELAQFDAEKRTVTATRRTTFEELVLDERPVQLPRGREVERVLVAAAAEDVEAALAPSDDVASFRHRVAFLRDVLPDLELPTLDDDALRELLPQLAAGRRSFDELRKAPLLSALQNRLDWKQREALDRHAPERVQVPSGSRVRIVYEPGRPPTLPVRIQEVFGWTETPRIAGGRVPLLLHLLAPNGRPQQVTDDLASFWASTYAVVRAELRRRYPKHAWPEDPLTAQPERRPRRRR